MKYTHNLSERCCIHNSAASDGGGLGLSSHHGTRAVQVDMLKEIGFNWLQVQPFQSFAFNRQPAHL